MFFFFFNDTATTEIYTLSLHDALPIFPFVVPRFDRPEHGLGRDLRPQPSSSIRRDEGHEIHRAPRRQDRKSTRLNSSHSQISYAVFCLKKKKKDDNSEVVLSYF